MNNPCAEFSRRDDEFQRRDVACQRSIFKVIGSPQRSRSADLRYDSALSEGGFGYRELSRCWYDVAVARDAVAMATVANGYRKRQQQQPQQLSPAR